jgi:hypothetical protein
MGAIYGNNMDEKLEGTRLLRRFGLDAPHNVESAE